MKFRHKHVNPRRERLGKIARLQGYLSFTRLDSDPSSATSTTSKMAPSMETESVAEVQVSKNQHEITTPAQNSVHEAYQYLDLIREILDNGEHRPDR